MARPLFVVELDFGATTDTVTLLPAGNYAISDIALIAGAISATAAGQQFTLTLATSGDSGQNIYLVRWNSSAAGAFTFDFPVRTFPDYLVLPRAQSLTLAFGAGGLSAVTVEVSISGMILP
jgi:hypothetical protein